MIIAETFTVQNSAASNVGLSIGLGTEQYEMGDISLISNGVRFLLDGSGISAEIYGSVTNQRLLALSVGTGDYSIGDLDVIRTAPGWKFTMGPKILLLLLQQAAYYLGPKLQASKPCPLRVEFCSQQLAIGIRGNGGQYFRCDAVPGNKCRGIHC